MFKLDNSGAMQQARRLIESLQSLEQTEEQRLANTAQRSERLVQWRVQQEGQNTDGEYMVSKSRNRIGAYSQMAGLDRESRGLQTDHIDLTVTGEMWRGWESFPNGTGGYDVGFNTDNAAYKADEVEMLFGQIFGMTPDEQDETFQYHNEQIEEHLRGR